MVVGFVVVAVVAVVVVAVVAVVVVAVVVVAAADLQDLVQEQKQLNSHCIQTKMRLDSI